MYGMRIPPPTKKLAAQMHLGRTTFRRKLQVLSQISSCSCSSRRDQTLGNTKKLLRRSDEKPSPDPCGGAKTVAGSKRLARSLPSSEKLNHLESGSIPGAHQYQMMVSSVARLV